MAPAIHTTSRTRPVLVFISSPGDVAAERTAALQVVAELNEFCLETTGRVLEPIAWEERARPAVGVDPQDVINRELGPVIGKADIFVCILWSRLGTPTERAASGTAEEFEQAYARAAANDFVSPTIMVYEKTTAFSPKTADESDQRAAVFRFLEAIKDKTLSWRFDDADEFRKLFARHLRAEIATIDQAVADEQEIALPLLEQWASGGRDVVVTVQGNGAESTATRRWLAVHCRDDRYSNNSWRFTADAYGRVKRELKRLPELQGRRVGPKGD